MMLRYLLLFLLGLTVVGAQEVAEIPEAAEEVRAQAEAKAAVEEEKQVDSTRKPKASKLVIPKSGKAAVGLQIFLDQKHFGPGFIDGKPGMFTRLAIENYNTSLGRKKKDGQVIAEAAEAIAEPYATAIIPSIVDDYVDPTLPREKEEQAERKLMSYRSVAEFMAERYHTSEDLLIELNGYSKVKNAKARQALKVPNIEPFKIEDLRTGRSHGKDEHLSARHIVIDTNVKQVYFYELMVPEAPVESADGSAVKLGKAKLVLIASFPITPGKTRFIPKGFWNLKNSVELPEWRYDKQLLETGVRGDEYLTIPPGPNNPVGIIWNGLTKSGIGIHGTNNPRTIGRARSAGCIRLANWDAARLPRLVRPGAVVVIK